MDIVEKVFKVVSCIENVATSWYQTVSKHWRQQCWKVKQWL